MENSFRKRGSRSLLILNCIFIITVFSFGQETDIELRRISGQGNAGISLELKAGMYDSILNSSESYYAQPVYQPGSGPVDVHIYDCQLCPLGLFTISLTGITDTSRWSLYSHYLDSTILGNSTIYSDYEQDIPQWGMMIRTKAIENPGEIESSYDNGYLNSRIIYEDSSRKWLGAVHDIDANYAVNWIRSGHFIDYANPEYNDWDIPLKSWDFYEKFENVISRSWSPYLLAAARSQNEGGPAYSIESKQLNDFQKIASIDLILTKDSSKWSRCCIVEMCHDSIVSQGHAVPFSLRNHPSVNVNGDTNIISANQLLNSNYISSEGMGWFPGYAINVETGERLNIIFGENTYLTNDNGRDMIWNPTSKVLELPAGDPVFGGFHSLYVMGAVQVDTFNFPRYDHGQYIHNLFSSSQNEIFKDYIYASTYWISIPLKNQSEGWLSNDVTIKIRVSKKYDYFENNEIPKYSFENKISSVINHNADLFMLYPNPTSGSVTIIANDAILEKEVKIMIYNYLGVQVNSMVIPEIQKRNELNLDWLKEGVYLLEMSDSDSKFVQKLIINR